MPWSAEPSSRSRFRRASSLRPTIPSSRRSISPSSPPRPRSISCAPGRAVTVDSSMAPAAAAGFRARCSRRSSPRAAEPGSGAAARHLRSPVTESGGKRPACGRRKTPLEGRRGPMRRPAGGEKRRAPRRRLAELGPVDRDGREIGNRLAQVVAAREATSYHERCEGFRVAHELEIEGDHERHALNDGYHAFELFRVAAELDREVSFPPGRAESADTVDEERRVRRSGSAQRLDRAADVEHDARLEPVERARRAVDGALEAAYDARSIGEEDALEQSVAGPRGGGDGPLQKRAGAGVEPRLVGFELAMSEHNGGLIPGAGRERDVPRADPQGAIGVQRRDRLRQRACRYAEGVEELRHPVLGRRVEQQRAGCVRWVDVYGSLLEQTAEEEAR